MDFFAVVMVGLIIVGIISYQSNSNQNTDFTDSDFIVPEFVATSTPITTTTSASSGLHASQSLGNPANTMTSSSSVTVSASKGVAPLGKKMAFGVLIQQGDSYECTVNEYLDPTFTTTIKGTIYVADKMVRGDFSPAVNDQIIKTSFIKKDGYVYTWSDQLPFGVKTIAQDSVLSGGTKASSGVVGWTPDMVGDYDCKSWKPQLELFALPNSIEFRAF